MSGKKVRELRAQFENEYGFTDEHRGSELYRTVWRAYKKRIRKEVMK
jgi:hypothetical protein